METHLYIVRHGETDFNRNGMVQGRGVDASLNELGQKQARALGTRFAEVALDLVFSSPLSRAVQTAQSVAQPKGRMICTDARLEEMSWGVYEGQPSSEQLVQAFQEMRTRWHKGEMDFAVEGGETLRQVQSRGVEAIHDIVGEHHGKRILIVAHGRFLRILLASLLTEYGIVRMEELKHTNTGVNHLVYDGDRYLAKLLNCTAHLNGVDDASS